MRFILNILCYLIGILWLAAGLSGVIDPAFFTESDYATIHVQITGNLGISDIRALGGFFAFLGLGILYATQNPTGKNDWFIAFSLLIFGLALGRTVSLYFEGLEETQTILAGVEFFMAIILYLKSK